MAKGQSNAAIAGRVTLSERTVEALSWQIFDELGLEPSPEVDRRVLAVLTLVRRRCMARPVATRQRRPAGPAGQLR